MNSFGRDGVIDDRKRLKILSIFDVPRLLFYFCIISFHNLHIVSFRFVQKVMFVRDPTLKLVHINSLLPVEAADHVGTALEEEKID
jgi:hypothetical protein